MQMKRVNTRLFALLSLVVLLEFPSTSVVRGLPQKERHSKQAELWRKQPPKGDAARPFTLPAVRESRFENGLTVLLH